MPRHYNNAYGPKTITRKEDSLVLTGPDLTVPLEAWNVGSVVELARLNIPFGYYAEIVRIDTLVQDATTGEAIGEWDNPNNYDGVFQFCLGYNSVNDKYFNDNNERFVQYASTTESWFNVVGCSPLPTLCQWPDNRYAWGNPSNEMKLSVAGQIVVRLFVSCTEATEYAHKVQGRLVAEWSLRDTEAAEWRAQR